MVRGSDWGAEPSAWEEVFLTQLHESVLAGQGQQLVTNYSALLTQGSQHQLRDGTMENEGEAFNSVHCCLRLFGVF